MKINFSNLTVCRDILTDKTLGKIRLALGEPKNNELFFAVAADLIAVAEKLSLKGNLIRAYLLYLLTQKDNPAARAIRQNGGRIGKCLKYAFTEDIKILMPLLTSSPGDIFPSKIIDEYEPTIVSDKANVVFLREKTADIADATIVADALIEYYRRFGVGAMADFLVFAWDGRKLAGIEPFFGGRLADLVGCDAQKAEIVRNTTAFVEGRDANNVLLVGARGTGKSSAVKALVNEYGDRGLRLLQLEKSQLKDLPKVMSLLGQIADKHFIIFLDDLSFEETDSEFKYLKSAIDGGLRLSPPNVLIYATSNRRHLIRENAQDSSEAADFHRLDGVNEAISLSDRFGIILHYYAPNQHEYLDIIDHKLKQKGIILSKELLKQEAVRWEMSHSGRNGRIAEQFVKNYGRFRS